MQDLEIEEIDNFAKSDILEIKEFEGVTIDAVGKVPASPKAAKSRMVMGSGLGNLSAQSHALREMPPPDFNTENYDLINENEFLMTRTNPLSTFSIDVDAASYANVRRFINDNRLPPKDAVRIEELINYFTYDYPQPEGKHPFSITTELSECPWQKTHHLLHIGLQGKKMDLEKLPPSNLVFLLDVSGSMDYPNKLPLLKSSFKLLVNQLRNLDRVSIVVYAGAAGCVLEPTPGDEKQKILDAIDRLQAGGSTAGGAGILLAYNKAKENFVKNGNNRVILATDGDFNIGVSSDAELVRLIEDKREAGIFLTVLGFGMGNYKDSRMEKLADKGNGNYAYIDNILEAKKVLVSEMGGTLFTIAKDVKIQIEFNPAKIQAYRLIGYENRKLQAEDFHDDKKDAGELGAGHSVTALYELIPVGVKVDLPKVDDLKYQQSKISDEAASSDELLTIKLRYKQPDESTSKLIEQGLADNLIKPNKTSDNFRFSSAVAGFGMLLRDSEFKGDLTFEEVARLAKNALGEDKQGYRHEFLKLVEKSELLK
ncbi:VWA domain-containing protein [candidate division KSB1 bacterium]|nr:VWA domain-containing protein [candidate division KSB1 bacterium]